MSGTYGLCLTLIFTALSVEGGLTRGVYDIFIRAITWVNDATTGGINQDDIVFTLLISVFVLVLRLQCSLAYLPI